MVSGEQIDEPSRGQLLDGSRCGGIGIREIDLRSLVGKVVVCVLLIIGDRRGSLSRVAFLRGQFGLGLLLSPSRLCGNSTIGSRGIGRGHRRPLHLLHLADRSGGITFHR